MDLEQTAIISLYNINWLVFITETECVYCVVGTGSLYVIQIMCFVCISGQTKIISLYSINWLVFITETECVYCAVWTGSLYVIQIVCFVWISEQTAIISLYSIDWLVFITETVCLLRGTDWIFIYKYNSSYGFFLWIWEKTAIISLYIIWQVFNTETKCVYCAVRTDSSNVILMVLPRKFSHILLFFVIMPGSLTVSWSLPPSC